MEEDEEDDDDNDNENYDEDDDDDVGAVFPPKGGCVHIVVIVT